GLFPEFTTRSTQVLISNFDKIAELYALPLLRKLRDAGVAAELYPASAKLKKQLAYADHKKIPYVVLIGEEEIASEQFSLKDMRSGEQWKVTEAELLARLAPCPQVGWKKIMLILGGCTKSIRTSMNNARILSVLMIST